MSRTKTKTETVQVKTRVNKIIMDLARPYLTGPVKTDKVRYGLLREVVEHALLDYIRKIQQVEADSWQAFLTANAIKPYEEKI